MPYRNRLTQSSLAAVVLLSVVASSAAQEDGGMTRSRGFGSMMNFEAMVDSYARMLARKYDLSDEQDQFTQQFLRDRTNAFVAQHESELRTLVDDLFYARTGGEMSQAELIEWGRRALPIYEEAKTIIVEGNDQWREILTDEQRRIHDQDVKLMWDSFATTEDQLGRIVDGDMTVEEFRNPTRNKRRNNDPPRVAQPPQQVERDPVQTAQPAERAPTTARPERTTPRNATATPTRTTPKASAQPGASGDPRATAKRGKASAKSAEGYEGQWDTYVREFIEKYELNDDQKQKAETILKDCKDKAERHMLKIKPQSERIEKELEELRQAKDKSNAAKLSELAKQKAKLLDPVSRIFEKELKPRLEKLPTRAQRKAAEEAAKKSKTPTAKRPTKKSAKDDED